jgi:hypothetical protein
MSHLQRVASILGTLLVGVAAYLIISDRSASNRRSAKRPQVEELAETLKQAWSGYHNR